MSEITFRTMRSYSSGQISSSNGVMFCLGGFGGGRTCLRIVRLWLLKKILEKKKTCCDSECPASRDMISIIVSSSFSPWDQSPGKPAGPTEPRDNPDRSGSYVQADNPGTIPTTVDSPGEVSGQRGHKCSSVIKQTRLERQQGHIKDKFIFTSTVSGESWVKTAKRHCRLSPGLNANISHNYSPASLPHRHHCSRIMFPGRQSMMMMPYDKSGLFGKGQSQQQVLAFNLFGGTQ